MNQHSDWLDGPEKEQKPLTDREKELLVGATPFQLKTYGNLDPATAEGMLVGYFMAEPSEGDNPSTAGADKILDANLSGRMFESKELGIIFDHVMGYYKETHKLLSYDNASLMCLNEGQSRNDASMFRKILVDCKGAVVIRSFDPELVIESFVQRYLQKQQDRIYKKAVEERANPSIGPRKSWENMRDACVRDLVDPRGGPVREFDWMRDYKSNVTWLHDMKLNPEKYMGYYCGIRAIDISTKGFRNGQLTVVVGAHGGCKTTLLLNVAYGLWEKGYDVLFVSLEMEASIVQLKFWCRATGQVSYSKAYGGQFTHPEDWQRVEEIEQKLKQSLPETEREKLIQQLRRYREILAKTCKGDEDAVRIERYVQKSQGKKNRLKILNFGQSKKMRLSQLDRWLRENSFSFKPHVVIVDYLDLIDPENPNPDRPDIGYGDICKMLRNMGQQMGFAPITAAQLRRSAWERLRRNGLENPEKSQLDTDDIGSSHQIGADADNVFMLWRKPGNTTLQIFTAKARYGEKDIGTGVTLQLDFESNTISDNGIEDIRSKNEEMSTSDIWGAIGEASKHIPLLPGQEGFDPEPPAEGPTLDLSPEGEDDLWNRDASPECNDG